MMRVVGRGQVVLPGHTKGLQDMVRVLWPFWGAPDLTLDPRPDHARTLPRPAPRSGPAPLFHAGRRSRIGPDGRAWQKGRGDATR